MILIWLLGILLFGGILAWAAGRVHPLAARWISLLALLADLAITVYLWVSHAGIQFTGGQNWFEQANWQWIPELGIRFHLAMDGLSLLLVLLTTFLGVISVMASWKEIDKAVGFFHFNLMWALAGVVGVLLSLDLFLFYFSWELMLVPTYFLIAVWGRDRKRRAAAATKFFIFSQMSSLLMIIAILALFFAHHAATGVFTFEYGELLGTAMSPHMAMWIMLGFFIAFAVKLPMVPVHTWLADAYTEAPTAGSIVLAGLLATTGGYGLIRFVVPLFPGSASQFAPIAMILGIISILYGAILAFGQTDFKRLIAYTSISHLGFVLLAVFAANQLALEGALITLICHGITTGALFLLSGSLEERLHSREMADMGGLWDTAPRLSGATQFFAMALMGLPGLGDFVGEFLILLGTYRVSIAMTAVAAGGVLASTLYALKMIQEAFHGPNVHERRLPDLFLREGLALGIMIGSLLWLGLYPQPVFHLFANAASQFPVIWR